MANTSPLRTGHTPVAGGGEQHLRNKSFERGNKNSPTNRLSKRESSREGRETSNYRQPLMGSHLMVAENNNK